MTTVNRIKLGMVEPLPIHSQGLPHKNKIQSGDPSRSPLRLINGLLDPRLQHSLDVEFNKNHHRVVVDDHHRDYLATNRIETLFLETGSSSHINVVVAWLVFTFHLLRSKKNGGQMSVRDSGFLCVWMDSEFWRSQCQGHNYYPIAFYCVLGRKWSRFRFLLVDHPQLICLWSKAFSVHSCGSLPCEWACALPQTFICPSIPQAIINDAAINLMQCKCKAKTRISHTKSANERAKAPSFPSASSALTYLVIIPMWGHSPR